MSWDGEGACLTPFDFVSSMHGDDASSYRDLIRRGRKRCGGCGIGMRGSIMEGEVTGECAAVGCVTSRIPESLRWSCGRQCAIVNSVSWRSLHSCDFSAWSRVPLPQCHSSPAISDFQWYRGLSLSSSCLAHFDVTVAVTLFSLANVFRLREDEKGSDRCDGVPVPRPNFIVYALRRTRSMSPSFVCQSVGLWRREHEALAGARDGLRVHGFEVQNLFEWRFVFP